MAVKEIVHHYNYNDYLHWGLTIPHIWFEWWKVDEALAFTASMVVLFFAAFMHEMLSSVRQRMAVYAAGTHLRTSSAVGSATFVRLLEAIMSALLILAVVSFNAWMILSICVGSAMGHFFMLNMDEGPMLVEPALH